MKRITPGLFSYGKVNNSFFPSDKERMKLNEIKTMGLTVEQAVSHISAIVTTKKEPICIMMVGMPASGKSTFTRKLEAAVNRQGAAMLPIESTDEQAEAAAKKAGQTYRQYMDQNYATMIGVFLKNVSDNVLSHVSKKQGFIIDQTLMKKAFRKEHIDRIGSNDYYKIALTFEIDPTVLDQRLKDRASKTGKEIPQETLERMRKEYERPDRSEGFDEVILITAS